MQSSKNHGAPDLLSSHGLQQFHKDKDAKSTTMLQEYQYKPPITKTADNFYRSKGALQKNLNMINSLAATQHKKDMYPPDNRQRANSLNYAGNFPASK